MLLSKEIKEFPESTNTVINGLSKSKTISLLLEAFNINMHQGPSGRTYSL